MLYYLLSIPTISKLAMIHYQHVYPSASLVQTKLLLFSPERYHELVDNTKPEIDGILVKLRYTMAKHTTSKYGDFLFGNYSLYKECGRLIDFDGDYMALYNKLPKSYRKRIDEIYGW